MYKMQELDGKTMKIKDFLDQKREIPKCRIYISDGVSLRTSDEDELKTWTWSDSGTFYVYEDEDGSFPDIGRIIRRELWFIVKDKPAEVSLVK